MHSYTSLSHKGPYDAFLATYHIRDSPRTQLSTLIRSQGEGGNPLARQEAGETTPPRGCSCLHPVVVVSCQTPMSVHRDPCSPKSCKSHPVSTRRPTRRLLSGIIGQVLTLDAFREPPTFRPSATAWSTASSLIVMRQISTKQPAAPILREGSGRFAGTPRENTARSSSTAFHSAGTWGHYGPSRPCGRPLLEVAPPRTMSWR